jgi:hypothetical protein
VTVIRDAGPVLQGGEDVNETGTTAPGPVVMQAPWWLGLPGIDPGCPVASVPYAAELIAAALGAHYLTLESSGSRLFNAPASAYKLVTAWQAWLASASSTADLQLRRVALQVVLESGSAAHANVLRTAADLHEAARARKDRTW